MMHRGSSRGKTKKNGAAKGISGRERQGGDGIKGEGIFTAGAPLR